MERERKEEKKREKEGREVKEIVQNLGFDSSWRQLVFLSLPQK